MLQKWGFVLQFQIVLLGLLLAACNFQAKTKFPISSGEQKIYRYDHSSYSSQCRGCHEQNRPTVAHNPGLDCSGCHTPGTRWLDVKVYGHSPTPATCFGCHEPGRPKKVIFAGSGFELQGHFDAQDCSVCHPPLSVAITEFTYQHTENGSAVTSCLPCHEHNRPTSVVNQFLHAYKGTADCGNCHTKPGVSWSGAIYGHNPAPANCQPCHNEKRPIVSVQRFDHAVAGTGDCKTCHTYPGGSWSGGVYNHLPRPSACTTCHDGDRPIALIQKFQHTFAGMGDCVSCHRNVGVNWSGARYGHIPRPTSCGECHEPQRASNGSSSWFRHTYDKNPVFSAKDCTLCHRHPGEYWKPVASGEGHQRDGSWTEALNPPGFDAWAATQNPVPSACSRCHGG